MPNLPISGLPSAGTLTGTELFAIVQGGITKQVALNSVYTSLTSNYGLFNQTGSSTPITNTTTESSLIAGGVGSLLVPANTFKKGDAYHATLTGHISAQNNDTLRIRIKSNSVVLADTGTVTMSGVTSKHWKMEIYFSIYNIGTTGVASIVTGGNFQYTQDAAGASKNINFSTENNTTFNTTINNTLVITAQWNAADTDNSIYSDICTLNKTF